MTKIHEVIYLAGPYSHASDAIRHDRYEKLTHAAAILMNQGNIVYSPITHSHVISVKHDLPTDWKYWNTICEAMLSRCDKLLIVQLDGWDTSVGVAEEIKIAEKFGIPIEYMDINV